MSHGLKTRSPGSSQLCPIPGPFSLCQLPIFLSQKLRLLAEFFTWPSVPSCVNRLFSNYNSWCLHVIEVRLRSVNFIGYQPQNFFLPNHHPPPKNRKKGKETARATDRPLFRIHCLSACIRSCFLWRELPLYFFFPVRLVYKWNGVTAPIKMEHCALSLLLTGGKTPLSVCEICLKYRNFNLVV